MNESIFIENDNSMTIKGAKKVVSSTQNQAVVMTGLNTLVISGSNIEVKKLDLEGGEVCLSGKFTNVKISTASAGKTPLLKRIFK